MKLAIKVIQKADGRFVASCPCLPGCTSEGQTRADAVNALSECIRGYVAAVCNFVPDCVECEVQAYSHAG